MPNPNPIEAALNATFKDPGYVRSAAGAAIFSIGGGAGSVMTGNSAGLFANSALGRQARSDARAQIYLSYLRITEHAASGRDPGLYEWESWFTGNRPQRSGR